MGFSRSTPSVQLTDIYLATEFTSLHPVLRLQNYLIVCIIVKELTHKYIYL